MGLLKKLGIFNIYANHFCPNCNSLLTRYYDRSIRLVSMSTEDDTLVGDGNTAITQRSTPMFKCNVCGKRYSVEELGG